MLFENIMMLDENMTVQDGMYVGTEADRITYVGPEKPDKDYGETYNGKDRLLMPGFYNAHAHSPMALMRGYGENLKLQDWLNTRIFPFEAKLTGDAVYWGTMLCMAESLRFGIVSTSDMYYFVEDMARAVADSGCKNNISRSITNFTGARLSDMESMKELEEAVRSLNGAENGRIIMEASLHAEYTSDPATAKDLADWTKANGARMHVHVSETKSEHEECKERHGGMTPVEYLDSCGIFDVPSIAAHCVWIEGNDYDILKEKGVTVATNPCSNLKLASGICDTPVILKKGINLAIGTDSVASNNSLDFLEEIKTLAMLGKVKHGDPTAITPAEALYAATRGGAIAQGRDDCGLIKEGCKADLIVMRTDVPNMHPIHDMINNIVYSASGSDIVLTMVDGRMLYKDGVYATIDIDKTVRMAEEHTGKILALL
ncbi:MAG: amidohydrolase [Eubacterium sp.]|nr:amidohydrolase [Eubacterium sp.]